MKWFLDAINALGGVINIGTNWVNSKIEISKVNAEAAVEIAKAEAKSRINIAEKKVDGEIAWENTLASQMDRTWKDEYLTLVFTIPAIMAFFPPLVPYVNLGFQALSTMPEWYQYAVGVVVASGFAIRSAVDMFARFRSK